MVSNTFVKALLLVSLGPAVLAQSLNYEQCGGEGWTGPSSCAVGSCCIVSNEFYSQCIPGSCNPTTTIVPRATQIAPAAAPPSIARRASGCGKSPGLTSGTKTITINGKTRRYTLRLPDGYSNSKQYKVIWVYHPSGGTAATTVSSGYNGLLALSSNAKNVIFVAPQGGEDIAFTDAVNALIDNGLCINPKLRFVTGFSYGGGMTYSIACSRAKVFRAVSVVAGTQLSGCAGGNDPIPYLGIHGVADPTIGVSIGRSLRDKFVRNNGCQATKAPEPAKGAGSSRIKTEFKGCRSGFPVTWIAHGAAHTDLVRDASNKLWIPVETDLFFNQFK